MSVPAKEVSAIPASTSEAGSPAQPSSPLPVGSKSADLTEGAPGAEVWEDILKADDDPADSSERSLPESLIKEGEKKPQEVPAPKAAEAPAATPPATPPVVKAPTPKPAEAPAPVAKAPQTPAPPAEPQQTAEQRLALREGYISELSRGYTLTAEQEAKMVTAPNEVLPQLAARLRVDIVDQVVPLIVQHMMQSLPGIIDQHSTKRSEAAQTEGAFFDKWGELKGQDALIQRIASQWRQMNPQASREEAIQEVGILAWRAAKLPLDKLINKLADPPKGQPVEVPIRQPPPRAPQGFAPAPNAAAGGAPGTPGRSWQEELLSYEDEDS